MQGTVRPTFVPLSESHSADDLAANTDAVCSLAAAGGEIHVTACVLFSYSDEPTAGKLQWTVGSDVRSIDIVRDGAGQLSIPMGIAGDVGEAVEWRLTAGGAGVVGKLHVYYA